MFAQHLSASACNRNTLPTQGVLALVGGRQVAVGNSRLLVGQGICLTDEQAAAEAAWQAKGAKTFSQQSSLCGSVQRAQCARASGAADLATEQPLTGMCRRNGCVGCHRQHRGRTGGGGRPAARRSRRCGMAAIHHLQYLLVHNDRLCLSGVCGFFSAVSAVLPCFTTPADRLPHGRPKLETPRTVHRVPRPSHRSPVACRSAPSSGWGCARPC